MAAAAVTPIERKLGRPIDGERTERTRTNVPEPGLDRRNFTCAAAATAARPAGRRCCYRRRRRVVRVVVVVVIVVALPSPPPASDSYRLVAAAQLFRACVRRKRMIALVPSVYIIVICLQNNTSVRPPCLFTVGVFCFYFSQTLYRLLTFRRRTFRRLRGSSGP